MWQDVTPTRLKHASPDIQVIFHTAIDLLELPCCSVTVSHSQYHWSVTSPPPLLSPWDPEVIHACHVLYSVFILRLMCNVCTSVCDTEQACEEACAMSCASCWREIMDQSHACFCSLHTRRNVQLFCSWLFGLCIISCFNAQAWVFQDHWSYGVWLTELWVSFSFFFWAKIA